MAVLKFILILLCQDLLIEGQDTYVYIGTGLNGTSNYQAENDIVLLGGLFVVHMPEDGKCTEIVNPSIQRIEAMALAVQKINDDPDLLPGITLGFEIRETCTQTNQALEQSLNFVTGRTLAINRTVLGISGVVGATLSEVSISVARLLRLFKIPQISFASTAVTLSDKDVFDYFLRTVPPDSLQAQSIADIVEYFNWTYVIAINTASVYGQDGIDAFISELGKRNTTQRCIATTSIKVSNDATSSDFDDAVEKINQVWVKNASVVVMFAGLSTATGILEAVQRKQMTDPEFALRNLTWIGVDAWGDAVPENLYETAQGLLGVLPQTILSEEFDDYFQSLNPSNNSDNPWFGEYWESVFNCSLQNPPAEGKQECNIENQTISSESGYRQSAKVTLTIDAVYAFAHAIHNLQRDLCQGGPGLCSDIIDTRSGGVAIQGDLLLQYLYNVSFPGTSTELIDFDTNGDQRGGYTVINLQKKSDSSFGFEVVGDWDEDLSNRISSLQIYGDIQWSHGSNESVPISICSHPCGNGEYPEPIADQAQCCWVCRTCPGNNEVSTGLACTTCALGYTPNENNTECIFIEPSYLTWSHGWSIAIIILTIIGIIVTTIVATIFIVYYKHKLIKASSRELSAVLLTGIMLCYILPFFYIEKPSEWNCAIQRFGVGFCFSLCYSALLVKTNRIHRIFNQLKDSIQAPHLISPQSQLFFTALLVAVQVVIATVWLIAERPSVVHVYNTMSTELKCGESPYIGLSITLGYNFILLFITTYFAFRTRKVPQNFNEAKFISFTVYTLCILWIAFIPIYFATTSLLGTIYQTGSLMLVIILNASITLCFLFAPKIYYLFFKKQKENKSELFTMKPINEKVVPYITVDTSSPQRQPSPNRQKQGEIKTSHADSAAVEMNGKVFKRFVDTSTQT